MSTLSDRYASPAMKQIWSSKSKIASERRLWITVMRAQSELGLDIPAAAIADYERVIDSIDLESIDKRERELRHDVKARIEEFNSLATDTVAPLPPPPLPPPLLFTVNVAVILA